MVVANNECQECKFCTIIACPEHERDIQDTILDETAHFQWLPGLGAFIEGYSLIVSKGHFYNTGCLEPKVIRELDSLINKVKGTTHRTYNKIPIIFEHGSVGQANYAGSCINHHHIHILPMELSEVPNILLKNFKHHEQITSIEELRRYKENPYIYYVTPAEEHHVFESPILPRQYLRQVLASECGLPLDWDWRKKPYIENVCSFVEKIKPVD